MLVQPMERRRRVAVQYSFYQTHGVGGYAAFVAVCDVLCAADLATWIPGVVFVASEWAGDIVSAAGVNDMEAESLGNLKDWNGGIERCVMSQARSSPTKTGSLAAESTDRVEALPPGGDPESCDCVLEILEIRDSHFAPPRKDCETRIKPCQVTPCRA